MNQWRTPTVAIMIVLNVAMLAVLGWAYVSMRPGASRNTAPSESWIGGLSAQVGGTVGTWRPAIKSPSEAIRAGRPTAWLGLAFMLLGTVWFYAAAFRAGIWWGLACLLLPLAQLGFLVVHFPRAARPTGVILFGAALMVLL
jgi:hypothetical protein